MFKKLQHRFMWVSTLVLLLVICVVTGVVYWITSEVIMSQTGVLMELILENDGDLPERSEFNANQEMFLALNVESMYEMRFISAEESDGDLQLIRMHIAMLSEEDALSLAQTALNHRGGMGRIKAFGKRIFHYARSTADDGSTMVVVLDSTSRYGLQRLIMMIMAILWFAVLVLYVVIMGRYSKKLIKPFVENDEKQKRFITNASHELKTPLAVISANTEMTEVLGGKSKWTESTRRQVTRLQTLIEDLVVLARLDEMKEMEMADVDLSTIAVDTAEPFLSVAENAGKRLKTDIDSGIHVKGDKRALQQVMTILLDNAVKYCDDGGVVAIALKSRAHGKGARITVSNSYAEGKDIDLSRFFERFYRQDESHNSEKSGFGIGLSMAKEIVERMKGKLKVSYEEDVITFTVDV